MKNEEKQKAREQQIKALIKIDDNYGIAVEPLDYSLRKILVNKKTGKQYHKVVGYYGSVAKCLKCYVRETMHDTLYDDKDIDLTEALSWIEKAIDKVYGIINDAFPEYTVTEK